MTNVPSFTPEQAAEMLYRATRQLQASAEAHEALAQAYRLILEALATRPQAATEASADRPPSSGGR